MSISTSPRALEYGPVAEHGGFFARDLQVGDVIADPEGRWVPIVAIEDSPHGERAIELASGEILMSDLVEDEIFAILPGTFVPVDVVLDEAQHALREGFLESAYAQALIVHSHRDSTDEHRELARIVLESVLLRQAATR